MMLMSLQEAKEFKERLVNPDIQAQMDIRASEVSQDYLVPVANQDHLDHLDYLVFQDLLAFQEKGEIM